MIRKSTARKRLLELAKFLEKVPRKRFDMQSVAFLPKRKVLGECGTSGCVAGYATCLPFIRKKGYALAEDSFYPESYYPSRDGKFVDLENMMMDEFGLTYREVGQLCYASISENPTPKQKAAEVRKLADARKS